MEKAKLRSNYKRLRVREGIDDHGPRHAVVREGSGSDSDSGQDNDGEEAEREEDDDEEEVGFAAPVAAEPAKGKPRVPVSEPLPRAGAGAAAQGAAAGGKHHGGGAGRSAGRSVGVRGESAVATEDDGHQAGGRGPPTHGKKWLKKPPPFSVEARERVQAAIADKAAAKAQAAKEKEEKLKKRQRMHQELSKRSSRGQPVMDVRARLLLEKVQKLMG